MVIHLIRKGRVVLTAVCRDVDESAKNTTLNEWVQVANGLGFRVLPYQKRKRGVPTVRIEVL
jgi:hypothetical protein